MSDQPNPSPIEAHETMALQALAFLASDPQRLADFVALTGITPEDLRRRAGEHDLMLAALEQLLQDEAHLLMFCANAGIAPQDIARAHASLEAHKTGPAPS